MVIHSRRKAEPVNETVVNGAGALTTPCESVNLLAARDCWETATAGSGSIGVMSKLI